MNAKNIKIIVRDGKVMLRGPVDSQQHHECIFSLPFDAYYRATHRAYAA
jgi:hypothetical protein